MPITAFQYKRVKGQPRPKRTYRAARRNACKSSLIGHTRLPSLVWRGAAPPGGGPYRWAIRPNVSRKRPAKRYA